MKRTRILILLAVVLCAALLLVRFQVAKKHERLDLASTQLEEILTGGGDPSVIPSPGNHIRELIESEKGRRLLMELDESQERLAVEFATEAYACVWTSPKNQQSLFVDSGNKPGMGLTAGLPSQIRIEGVRIENGDLVLIGKASMAEEDRAEVTKIFRLEPGGVYEVKIPIADLSDVSLIDVWEFSKRQGASVTTFP